MKLLAPVRWLLVTGLLAACCQAQITEWATTVQPGRFLVEMDALSLTFNHDDSGRYTGVGVASTFVTTGLTKNWDVQVGAELFLNQKFTSGGLTDRHSGVGDIYFRTKWRFYEDETTGTAVALLPYVKLPTNSDGVGNQAVEGGLIVPWQTTLPGAVTVSAMAELDLTRNDRDNGYDSYWYTSAALQRQFTKAIGAYGEVTLGKSSGGAPWAGTIGGGVTLALSDNFWWDFAVYRGVSRGASDWNQVIRLNWGF
jgi:hypothetical protein